MDISCKYTKTNKKIYYKLSNNKTIKNNKLINHINSIKIPPAYSNIKISSNTNNKILATGIDSKGRKQYIYNKNFIENQEKIKFNDLIIFGKNIHKIRRDINKIINYSINNNIISKETLISIVLYLIDKCNFRVGSEKYKVLYNSYGATTINSSHIFPSNNSIKIEFIGKKGILNTSIVNNSNINTLLNKILNLNRDNVYLFSFVDKNKVKRITEIDINNFLKKYNPKISCKMFRTWNANYILIKELCKNTNPNIHINQFIKKSADALHNSINVCKNKYIYKNIIDTYKNNPNRFIETLNKNKTNTDNILIYFLTK
jgi:DNA topoisomerase-1